MSPSIPATATSSPPLAALDQVFAEWRRVLDAYASAVSTDLPWWYNETAAVGFLAAAAWRVGGVAIVEFESDRTDVDSGERFRGRSDLYLKLGEAAFFAEAKQTFHELHESSDYREEVARVEALLDAATSQLRSLCDDEGAGLLAMVFVSPRIRWASADTLERSLELWETAMRVVPSTTAYLHLRPDLGRARVGSDRLIYPGVALLVREVPPCLPSN